MVLPGLVAFGLALLIAGLVYRRWQQDAVPLPGRGRGEARVLTVDGAPGTTVEIDARWPGRTRLRVAAPAPIPLQSPTRLVPRSVRRRGRDLSRAFGDLVWTGRGADDVARWASVLEEPLRALWGWRDRYTLQATLTPLGLIVHLPLVAPTPAEEPFLIAQARQLAAGLHQLSDAAMPPGMRFGLAEIADADCPTCWERVGSRGVVCDACGARQHADCFRWTGGCGRFGCTGLVPA